MLPPFHLVTRINYPHNLIYVHLLFELTLFLLSAEVICEGLPRLEIVKIWSLSNIYSLIHGHLVQSDSLVLTQSVLASWTLPLHNLPQCPIQIHSDLANPLRC